MTLHLSVWLCQVIEHREKTLRPSFQFLIFPFNAIDSDIEPMYTRHNIIE